MILGSAGVPNTLNVMTNFPFLVVGVLGLVLALEGGLFNIRFFGFCEPCYEFGYLVSFQPLTGIVVLCCCSSQGEVWAWALFYAGITGMAFGSAYYHLKPDDHRVMWDTLPVSFYFAFVMSFFSFSILQLLYCFQNG